MFSIVLWVFLTTFGARSTPCIKRGDIWIFCIAALCTPLALSILHVFSVAACGSRCGRVAALAALAAVATWGSVLWVATDDACYLAHGPQLHPLLAMFRTFTIAIWASLVMLTLHAVGALSISSHIVDVLGIATGAGELDIERAPLHPETEEELLCAAVAEAQVRRARQAPAPLAHTSLH